MTLCLIGCFRKQYDVYKVNTSTKAVSNTGEQGNNNNPIGIGIYKKVKKRGKRRSQLKLK
jgi:hypothetical protein